MIYNANKGISYRSGADPAIVKFRNEYYLFVTRSLGYWHSTDLLNWDFISPEKWYFQGSNAPAASNYKDSILYVTSYVPTPFLSISDMRIFGIGNGKKPTEVKNFSVNRKNDTRNALIKWTPQPNCQGYNILWGIAPDKLYSSWMVYDADSLMMRNLNAHQKYYFSIEAFNENGISERAQVIEIK